MFDLVSGIMIFFAGGGEGRSIFYRFYSLKEIQKARKGGISNGF
jgi:hypothetical protein